MTSESQNIFVLGATGSIGKSTFSVVRARDRYRVFGMSGHTNAALLISLALEFLPRYVVVTDQANVEIVVSALRGTEVTVLSGQDELVQLMASVEFDTVVAGIVGKAGLEPTLAAANAGKKLLLANKESMVMAGPLFQRAIAQSAARILPIDSEHNAIFQALPGAVQQSNAIERGLLNRHGVDHIVLTASGGPFLSKSPQELLHVTPEAAVRHPNWSMGAKVSVDSASLMNKGLELIEACYLFGVQESFVKVVVHPQSIVHSMVTYVDGTTLAHLSHPAMEVPIGHGLAFPQRREIGVRLMAWDKILRLDFLPLDLEQFPCFRLARESMVLAENGAAAPTVLNAANEVAVEQFLKGVIRFVDIPRLVESSLEEYGTYRATELPELLELDLAVREATLQSVYLLKN